MKITAKFPGKCAACGVKYPEGERIEWVKGTPSRHVVCPSVDPEQAAAEAEYEAERYVESAYERSNDAWAWNRDAQEPPF